MRLRGVAGALLGAVVLVALGLMGVWWVFYPKKGTVGRLWLASQCCCT